MSQLTETCLTTPCVDRPLFTFWHEQHQRREHLEGEQFVTRVKILAAALCRRYPPQSRILLLFEPGLEFPLAFWACLRAGMVAVPTYPPADPRTRSRLLEIVADAEACAVLTSSRILGRIRWLKWLVGSFRRMQWHALEDLLQENTSPLPETAETDLALLQYTSGSTARPRGVMLTHAQIYANIRALAEPWQLLPPMPEHFVIWLPLYHDMGLMAGVIFPLYIRASVSLLSPLYFLQKPHRWLLALSETQGTISAAPNFAYDLCVRKISPEQLQGLDLSHWRVTLNGAEMIQAETLQRFSALLKDCGFQSRCFYNAYGLAESTVFVTGGNPGHPPQIQGFDSHALSQHRIQPDPAGRLLVGLGHPWSDTRLAIVDSETGRRCAHDQVGEIWVQGSSVGSGYWKRPKETQHIFRARLADAPDQGFWLRTGDLGFIWQGQLYFTGRLKELIIRQGQNYAPQTIERAVQQASTWFRTGCGAAFSVGEFPERLVLVQEVRRGCDLSAQELEQLARQALAEKEGLSLDDLVLVTAGSLPKTSSGKLQRRLIQSLYDKGKLSLWKKS